MKPHFTISASPAIRSRTGRVSRKLTSATTARGWWNAPTRFLPAPRSTPVLPPTEASTIASRVVGIARTEPTQIDRRGEPRVIGRGAAADADDGGRRS